MRCLKVLRAIEAGTPVEELVPADFKPSEKALALLSRGPSGAAQHPYVGGVEDTLVIRCVPHACVAAPRVLASCRLQGGREAC